MQSCGDENPFKFLMLLRRGMRKLFEMSVHSRIIEIRYFQLNT
jgi:hypothetical protein